jgi:uncharacterized RDD family membrane protein YckC
LIYFISYILELLSINKNFNQGINLTFGFFNQIELLLLYPALYCYCEYKWQKTPGKFLSKTIVINEYANKPDIRTIVLRSLIRIVPFDPLSCLGEKYSRGWHDKWSETWVVSEKEFTKLKELQLEQSEK